MTKYEATQCLEKARIAYVENDLETALEHLNEFDKLSLPTQTSMRLRVRVLFNMKEYKDALELNNILVDNVKFSFDDFIGNAAISYELRDNNSLMNTINDIKAFLKESESIFRESIERLNY